MDGVERKSLLLLTIRALRAGLTADEIVAARPETASIVNSPLVRAFAKGEGEKDGHER